MRALLLLVLSFAAYGQQVITWNRTMGHYYQEGRLYFKAASPSAMVVVTAVDTGQYIVFGVGVSNLSEKPLDVLPGSFRLSLRRPKTKALENVPPERVIGSINRAMAWSRLGSGLSSATATRQETTTSNTSGNVQIYGSSGNASGTYSGTTTSTRQVPDEQRRQQIWEEQRKREQRAADDARAVAVNTLRDNTISPGQSFKGVVFFKRDGSCRSREGCGVLLEVPLNGTIFEFHVNFKRP
jgi:hypothetical protein